MRIIELLWHLLHGLDEFDKLDRCTVHTSVKNFCNVDTTKAKEMIVMLGE